MKHTEEEKAFITEGGQSFEEAEELFYSFMEKYKRRKKLKRVYFTKNKKGSYLGKTIFVDMMTSYTYTEEEKELLYKCLIAIPSRVLFDFERLYIKSSLQKLAMRMKEMEERIKGGKEYLSLHTKFGKLSVWKDVALKEIKNLEEENISLDYGVYSLFEANKKMGNKYKKYPQLYDEIDSILKEPRNEFENQTKKYIIMSVLKKHIETEDIPELIAEYEEFGGDLEIYYEKRFKSAYLNYVRRKP